MKMRDDNMKIFKNSKGQIFQSGSGGTYPINDGNPENDLSDEDYLDEDEWDAYDSYDGDNLDA